MKFKNGFFLIRNKPFKHSFILIICKTFKCRKCKFFPTLYSTDRVVSFFQYLTFRHFYFSHFSTYCKACCVGV